MAAMTRVEIPYKPRYPEVHAALEAHRFAVLVAHRRFGKTVLVVNHVVKQACLSRMESGSYAYVAPFRNQAKAVAWDYFKHYTAVIPGRMVNESELSIAVPSNGGGAKIRIFGADNPDALRGLYFDGVVLDEVAQMKPEVWEEIIQPALADRNGWAVFIGTPKGVNLFSELYHSASDAQARGAADWCAMSYAASRPGNLFDVAAWKTLESYDLPFVPAVWGRACELYSGDRELPLPSGQDADSTIWLIQDRPMPFRLVAIMADVDFGEN